MSKWHFAETMVLGLTAEFLADLHELFAIDEDLRAVRLYWQWGGYDDSDHYGSYGIVEVILPASLDAKSLATQKPKLAALAWAFQHNHERSFQIFDEGSDGGVSLFIATRNGLFFALANARVLDDREEAAWMISEGDGIAHGLHQVEIEGHTTAHEQIAGVSEFRALFPDFCANLDQASEASSGGTE